MTLEALSLKTIINKLDCSKKAVIIQGNTWKKRFVAHIKTIQKVPDPHNNKEH